MSLKSSYVTDLSYHIEKIFTPWWQNSYRKVPIFTCKTYSMAVGHIFQNGQVTSNKMVHKKRHHFLAQFSIPFHMVCSVLLRVLASKTIKKETSDCLSNNFNQSEDGFLSQHSQQNGSHHVKGYGKLCQKMVSFLVYHFV